MNGESEFFNTYLFWMDGKTANKPPSGSSQGFSFNSQCSSHY